MIFNPALGADLDRGTTLAPGMKRIDSNEHEEIKEEMTSNIEMLAKNIKDTREKYPYYVVIPATVKVSSANQWIFENDLPLITDYDNGIVYRFPELEPATMFKLVFGGEFTDASRRE